MPKRQPTLADLALAARPLQPDYVPASWRAQTLDWLRIAKRFVLDESAARYLGRMIREYPRVIADAQDFAIQPYHTMWVELPFRPFYREVLGGPFETQPAGNEDIALGYLFNGPTVRVIAQSYLDGTEDTGVLPLQYRLHSPMTVDEQHALADAMHISRIGLDLWFWGHSAREFIGGMCVNAEDDAHAWDREGLRALRNNHSATLAPVISGTDASPMWERISNASAGDLRNIIALLLFLNRTANITLEEGVPTTQGWIRRKPRPLLSHRVIKLKLDPMPRLMRLAAGIGVKRRLHDVRGHFCHDRTAREGCPHGEEHAGDFGEWWEEYDVLRWACTRCGGKRWWKREHKRGQKDIGAVVQEYEVTK